MLPTLRIVLAALAISMSMAATAAELKVAASIKPIHSLVESVMTGTGSAALILNGGATPHFGALKPSQLRILQTADVIFHVSDTLESGLSKSLRQRAKAGARVVSLLGAPGLPDLVVWPLREGGEWEGDDDHLASTGQDPHIWLDPDNAVAIAHYIAAVLAKADPDNAAIYRANSTALAARLKSLAQDISSQLAPVSSAPFIVFHDAYQYFEKRFGLHAAGAITIDPDKRPGAQRLREIRQTLAQRGVVCVFAEPQFEVSYIKTVLEGQTARRAILDPLGAGLRSGPDAYFDLLRAMSQSVFDCLSGAP